jgi:anti-anti-sigma regulatory factor
MCLAGVASEPEGSIMDRPFREITLERRGDVFCVRLRHHRLSEPEVIAFADELVRLIADEGCRKMVISLGPGEVACLYSVFLAKLVMVHRLLAEKGGRLRICEASPATLGIFDACKLKEYFEFCPDQDSAVAAF